jgi:hypothetical protein
MTTHATGYQQKVWYRPEIPIPYPEKIKWLRSGQQHQQYGEIGEKKRKCLLTNT